MLRKTAPADLKHIPKDQMSRVTKITDGFVFQYHITSGQNALVHKKIPENKRQQNQKKDQTFQLTGGPIIHVFELSKDILITEQDIRYVSACFVNEARNGIKLGTFNLKNIVLKFPDHFYLYYPNNGATLCVTINGNNVTSSQTIQPINTRYFPHSQNQFGYFMTETVREGMIDNCHMLMLSRINEDKTFEQVKVVSTQNAPKNKLQYHTVDVLATELGFVQHQFNTVNDGKTYHRRLKDYHQLTWYDFEGNEKAIWSEEKSQDICQNGYRSFSEWCAVTHHDQTFVFAGTGVHMYVWQMVVEGEKYSFEFRAFTFPQAFSTFAVDTENERVLMTASNQRVLMTASNQLVVMEGFEPLVAARRTKQLLNEQFPAGVSRLVMSFLGHQKPVAEAKAQMPNYNDLDAVAWVLLQILQNPELNNLIEPIQQNHSAQFKPITAKHQLMEWLNDHDDGDNIFENIWDILQKNKHVKKICDQLKKITEKQVIIPFLNLEEVLKLTPDIRLYGMLLLLRQMQDLKKMGIQPEYPLGEMLLNWIPYLYHEKFDCDKEYLKTFEQIEAAFEKFKNDSVHQAEMSRP